MQTRQTTTKRPLIAPCKLQPGKQKHGTMRELCRDQRPGNHQQLLVRIGMQGRKGFGLNAEEGQRLRATGFGEQALAVIKGQAPGLMDASTSNRLNHPKCLPCQGTIGGHEIIPQA